MPFIGTADTHVGDLSNDPIFWCDLEHLPINRPIAAPGMQADLGRGKAGSDA